MSKNRARGLAARLDPIRTFTVPYRKNSKRANVSGGPDRTRTYDPALIKRML